MNLIDLHVHSSRSDGTYSPTGLVDLAIDKHLSAIALTDHDTIDGLEEACQYALSLKQKGIDAPMVIPGIEFSTQYEGKDVHILGYFIRYQDSGFRERLEDFIDSRIARNYKMCTLLQERGIDITFEKLTEENPGAVVTRAHYGKYLLKHNYVNSISEAFDKYIGDQAPCFVPREKVTPAQAVQLILDADGIPVLAHPILYHMSDARLEELVVQLKEAGLLGIEAVYSSYNAAEERQIRKLADKYCLLITGGSDFHGTNKPGLDLGSGYGKLVIPEELLLKMEGSRGRLLFTDMDGTLLNGEKKISGKMKAALDKLTDMGHRLILASGRPLANIIQVNRQLGLLYDNMMIIAFNGALIHDCSTGKNVAEYKLENNDIRYFIEEANRWGIHIHAYTDQEIICRKINKETDFYVASTELPIRTADDIPSVLENGSYKLQMIHLTDHQRLEDFREHMKAYCGDRILMIFSNPNYLEIMPGQAGKGNALNFVKEYLHVPRNHTFAAGDAENDLSMLQAAHTSIAVANATDEVKAVVDLVTDRDNKNDGLLAIIEKYFLNCPIR